MVTDKWEHQSVKFQSKGVDIVHPLDETAEHAYPFFSNATTLFEGSLTTRPGLELLAVFNGIGTGPIHSIFHHGDRTFVGTGARIGGYHEGTTWLVNGDYNEENNTGWYNNGEAVSAVPWNTVSGEPVIYVTGGVSAEGQMRKILIEEIQNYGIGIPPNMSLADVIVSPGTATVHTSTTASEIWVTPGDVLQWVFTYYSSRFMVESNPCMEGAGYTHSAAETYLHAHIVCKNSPDAQVDKIRLYRRGATLFDYFFVAETDMVGTKDDSTTVDDMNGDTWAAANEMVSFDNDQPFTTYNYDAKEVKHAMPVQVIFGPYMGKYMMGVGERYRPGYVYWCNAYNPDAAGAENCMEVTGSGEPLVTGFIYNGRAYVASKNNIYVIYPSTTGDSTFTNLSTNAGMGVWHRHSVTVGPKVWFLGKQGIYEFDGGNAINITENSLIRPLFYGGQYDTTLWTHDPVDWIATDEELRLAWMDPYLYFHYKGYRSFTANTWRYHVYAQRWEPWDVNVGENIRLMVGSSHPNKIRYYFGSYSSQLYQQDGYSDDGSQIETFISTRFFDQDSPREQKLFGDAMVEFEPNGIPITVVPYVNEDPDNGLPETILPTDGGRQRAIIQVKPAGSEEGVLARSISFNFRWFATTQPPQLHQLDIAYLPRPDERIVRETDWTDAGYPAPKYVRGLIIEADTMGNEKTLFIQGDGTTYATKSLPAEAAYVEHGAVRRVYQLSWTPPFRAINLRLITQDTDPWSIYKMEWVYDKEPECFKDWDTNWQDLDWPYEKYIKGVSIEADTQGEEKTINLCINGDSDTIVDSFIMNHDGRTITVRHFENVLARTMKLYSPDAGTCGYLYNVKWIWDREPPVMLRWETQENTFNLKGFGVMREAYVGVRSTDIICLDWWVDRVRQQRKFIDPTNGERKKIKVEFEAIKGKNFKFLFTCSEPFKLYLGDSEVRIKEWNQDLGWKVYQLPFEGGEENP